MSVTKNNGSLVKKGKIIPHSLNTPEKLDKENECTSVSGAPIELLTEFLFSLMAKNYEVALKHCKRILEIEPRHSKAQQFYPLILEKLKMKELESSSSESSDSDSSEFSESSDSSESSESSLSNNEIKSMQESTKSYKSSKDKAIKEINDRLGSNLTASKKKTKNG